MLGENFYVYAVSYLRRENPFHCFLSPVFVENLQARHHIGVDYKVNYWNRVKQNCLDIYKWSSDDTNVILNEAIQNHPILLQAIFNIKKLLGLDDQALEKVDHECNEFIKNCADFLSRKEGSLIFTIAQEFTMLNQQELIRSFLRENGFEDILIERKDSSVNGRHNVWIISGQYKSS